jgi:hypothetical protein
MLGPRCLYSNVGTRIFFSRLIQIFPVSLWRKAAWCGRRAENLTANCARAWQRVIGFSQRRNTNGKTLPRKIEGYRIDRIQKDELPRKRSRVCHTPADNPEWNTPPCISAPVSARRQIDRDCASRSAGSARADRRVACIVLRDFGVAILGAEVVAAEVASA